MASMAMLNNQRVTKDCWVKTSPKSHLFGFECCTFLPRAWMGESDKSTLFCQLNHGKIIYRFNISPLHVSIGHGHVPSYSTTLNDFFVSKGFVPSQLPVLFRSKLWFKFRPSPALSSDPSPLRHVGPDHHLLSRRLAAGVEERPWGQEPLGLGWWGLTFWQIWLEATKL